MIRHISYLFINILNKKEFYHYIFMMSYILSCHIPEFSHYKSVNQKNKSWKVFYFILFHSLYVNMCKYNYETTWTTYLSSKFSTNLRLGPGLLGVALIDHANKEGTAPWANFLFPVNVFCISVVRKCEEHTLVASEI